MESVIALSSEHGFTDFLPAAACSRGWAMAQQGKIEDGIPQIEESLAAARATGMELSRTVYLCTLAETLMDAGRLTAGLNAVKALPSLMRLLNGSAKLEVHRQRRTLW